MFKSLIAGAATSVLALGLATASFAETTLRGASAFGASHLQVQVFETLIEKMGELTDGRYTARDFPSGLIGPAEMVTGLRDGVADFGSMLMVYFPSDFPESNLPLDLSVVGTNPIAISYATTEYLVTCAACQAEFARVGQIYTGSGWTAPYQIQATSPVLALKDLEGYRLRTAGSLFTKWAEYMGAQSVQMPSSEIFEALNQKTVDAFFGNMPDMLGQQIQELLTDITLIDFGTFNSDSISFRQDLWADLSVEDREAFLKASMYARETGTKIWQELNQEALDVAKEEGIKIHAPSQDIVDRIDAFRTWHLDTLPEALEARGVKDGQAKIDRYLALVAKWETILQDADPSADAQVDLKMKEIWSKVDLASYGL